MANSKTPDALVYRSSPTVETRLKVILTGRLPIEIYEKDWPIFAHIEIPIDNGTISITIRKRFDKLMVCGFCHKQSHTYYSGYITKFDSAGEWLVANVENVIKEILPYSPIGNHTHKSIYNYVLANLPAVEYNDRDYEIASCGGPG